MRFFDMSLEIRIQVYEDIVQDEQRFFHGEVPALLRTRLQITQEVYEHCKIVATVKSEIAPLFLHDLDDIERRVRRFYSVKGNKAVIVHLVASPELGDCYGNIIESELLSHRVAAIVSLGNPNSARGVAAACLSLEAVRDAPAEQRLDMLQKLLELCRITQHTESQIETIRAVLNTAFRLKDVA
ncbi:hypothetical protein D6D01_08692 [Aureobasidium pullulans]|uniref:Uncharacterized protein n=1 Tax=Aureobasidium pullulans TaxID=5580 RepID=A0A4S9KB96_AURPU|nr:hypothetical protein D6D01_08692 [Aureobasidium pullulans]